MAKDTASVTKADLRALKSDLLRAVKEATKEMKRHFDAVAETLTHDYRGIFKDRVETLHDARKSHEERLVRIERQLRLA